MRNERLGLVGHTDLTDAVAEEGVTVAESDLPGRRVITESVTGQVSAVLFRILTILLFVC